MKETNLPAIFSELKLISTLATLSIIGVVLTLIANRYGGILSAVLAVLVATLAARLILLASKLPHTALPQKLTPYTSEESSRVPTLNTFAATSPNRSRETVSNEKPRTAYDVKQPSNSNTASRSGTDPNPGAVSSSGSSSNTGISPNSGTPSRWQNLPDSSTPPAVE